MNIYDEAKEELKACRGDYEACCDCALVNTLAYKALERAKKEHELLGLYQNLWALPYGDIGVVELLRQIKQLEKELEEMK